MPPRGRYRAKTGAINHGLSLPVDHVAMWRCVQGHPFFTIGPVVAYKGLILIREDTAQLMIGAHGCRRVICGACHFSWTQQVPLTRPVQLMLRSVFRLDGEVGVQYMLSDHFGYPVGFPHFQMTEQDEIGCQFPSSGMTEGLRLRSRYVGTYI